MACCGLKQNCSKILCSCLTVIAGVILILFSAIMMAAFSDSNLQYQSFLNNWKQDPITDIYMPASLSTPCQANETPLFYYNWPGIASGCKCNDGTVIQLSCCSSTSSTRRNCCVGTSIQGVSSQTLDLWDLSTTSSSTNVVRLCAVRLQNYSFKEKAPLQNQCASNEKRCGAPLVSSGDSNYLYCVPNTSKCPIQQIQFSPTPVIDPITNQAWEQVSNFGAQSYSLYVNRLSTTMLPLSQIRISNTQTTCLDDGEQYIPQTDMVLDLRTPFCSNSESRFSLTKLSLVESIYFAANNMKAKIDSNVSGFTYNTQYPFFFLQKNYLMLNMDCRSNIPQLYSNESDIDYLKGILLAAFILCLIYGIELILLESWIGFKFPKYLWGFIIFRKKANSYLKIVYIFKFMLAIACIIVCFILAVKYTKQYIFYNDQVEKSCFDTEIVNIFQGFLDNMYPGLAIALLVVLFLILFLEPNVVYLLLNWKNPNRFKKQTQIDAKFFNNDNNQNNQYTQNTEQPMNINQDQQQIAQQPQYPLNQQSLTPPDSKQQEMYNIQPNHHNDENNQKKTFI